jgi:hypothetical protein
MKKWQKVYDMAGNVMSSGQYGLESDYAKMESGWREWCRIVI